jgi:hypothetical protein
MVELTRDERIIRIRCTTAAEFLEVLNPLGGAFLDAGGSSYIFRGVTSAAHELLPSAFRPTAELLFLDSYRAAPRPYVLEQCSAELHTLHRFFQLAAKHGTQLPGDSPVLRASLDNWEISLTYPKKSLEDYVWPPPDLYALIALAQHYGVPTRALDWTWSALVAAYFASDPAEKNDSDHMAVWVFSTVIERMDRIMSDRREPRSFVLFSASGADNVNLRAQRGLFMMQSQRLGNLQQEFVAERYDQSLRRSFELIGEAAWLYKVLVPRTEAESIRALLAAAGITAGALFPGLWGVARELREEREIRDRSAVWNRRGLAAEVNGKILEIQRGA